MDSMDKSPEELRRDVQRLQDELTRSQNTLKQKEANCVHKWNEPVFDPIRTEGYHYEPSGGGVDWRPGGYVSPTTTDRWKRECSVCKKVEHTIQKEQIITYKPKF
jgi:hypothetical protein